MLIVYSKLIPWKAYKLGVTKTFWCGISVGSLEEKNTYYSVGT